MAASFRFKEFIFGQKTIASRAEFKRLMLTGYLSLISMAAASIYVIIDVLHSVYYAIPAYAVMFCLPFLSLFLVRKSYYRVAKVLLIVSMNLVAFWIAANDPFETGVFLFFIPIGIGAFAILSFEEHIIGLVLAGFTVVLFLLAYFGDIKPLDIPRPSESYIRISFLFNYFTSLIIAILIVYFLMNLNLHSETELINKENLANQKNAELQKVNEELDRFVYSVSHDLRSPLSSILGLLNLARLTTRREELDEILQMIQGRVHAQDHFIREIIDYSRNARTEAINEAVQLRPLVHEIVESLKFNANASKIEFRNKVPDDLTLNSDRIRLTVILSNLIGNAIKYHDFRKENLFIEIGYYVDRSAIHIKDNGIGIMPEHQKNIFKMFYRGSDRSTGSGLGLFITKEAVTKLRGRIEVHSSYGEGSEFLVYLPAK